jgi:hypothetical protein
VLSVFLACDDPYAAADFMTGTLGWRLAFATPRDSDGRLACVGLGDAEVMLGTTDEEFLPAQSRQHRGAGVTLYAGCLAPSTSPPFTRDILTLAW